MLLWLNPNSDLMGLCFSIWTKYWRRKLWRRKIAISICFKGENFQWVSKWRSSSTSLIPSPWKGFIRGDVNGKAALLIKLARKKEGMASCKHWQCLWSFFYQIFHWLSWILGRGGTRGKLFWVWYRCSAYIKCWSFARGREGDWEGGILHIQSKIQVQIQIQAQIQI